MHTLGTMTEAQFDKKIDEKFNRFALQIFAEFSRQIGELRSEMDERFDLMDNKFSTLQSAVDGIAAGLMTEQQERLALQNQVGRHDNWITQLAQKTKTKLA